MSFLEVKRVSRDFGEGNKALDDFQISIEEGQILSIIGESGSGKSTLLRVIAGLEKKDEGEVWLDGEKVLGPDEKLVPGYAEIQLVHQQLNLYPNSTVEENIARPLLLFDKGYAGERLETLLSLFQLGSLKGRLPRQLSGGQQQKVAIARALSSEPKVLLMDEPFSNLDSIQKREILEELREIFSTLNVTVVWVTHDLFDAMAISDDLCVIKKGKPIQKGKIADLYAEPNSLYVASLFGPINEIPDAHHLYLRSISVKLFPKPANNLLPGKVISSRFMPRFNLLHIGVTGLEKEWQAEDEHRMYKPGDEVFLSYEQGDVLKLNA
ncbi:ABC transporter ATP-binding protein [Pleomorphovibrio marinus]|uniref:ABC transporter ATP-binding protein n=1 Tax=Pleomorphovibrio marinus TaxID=2164132 RepID=UPI000E0A8D07|nr:ABC transporter ATP-binding protein [Pleomorphovibrio marinus]